MKKPMQKVNEDGYSGTRYAVTPWSWNTMLGTLLTIVAKLPTVIKDVLKRGENYPNTYNTPIRRKDMMQLGKNGEALIKHFEGCKLIPYFCEAGVLTVGWGHTKKVKAGKAITQQKADELFKEDIAQFVKDVNSLVKVALTQNQFDALVSFAYNTGSDIDEDTKAEGLGDSTLLKLVNAGRFREAALEFPKWVNAGGKRSNGLVRRRAAEQRLFNTKDGAFYAVH